MKDRNDDMNKNNFSGVNNDNVQNTVAEALAQIKPPEGAKQRMLENIYAKASGTATVPKSAAKKSARFSAGLKRWLPVAACLVVMLLAGVAVFVANRKPNDQILGTPYQVVQSSEDFAQIGVSLEVPTGAEPIKYAIVDGNIAAVDFEYGGHVYYIVASNQTGDFSGIFGATISEEKPDGNGANVDATLWQISATPFNYWKLCFTRGKTTFYLCNTDGASRDEIVEVLGLISNS